MKEDDDDFPADSPLTGILVEEDGPPEGGLEAPLGQVPARREETPPGLLVVFPLVRSVSFPGLILPVMAENGQETEILEKAQAQGKYVGLLLARTGDKPPRAPGDFADTGVLAEIHKRIRLPDGNSNYICRGIRRFRVEKFVRIRKIPVARVNYPEDIYPPGKETDAFARNVLSLSQKVASHQPNLGEGFSVAVSNIEPAGSLGDFAAAYLVRDLGERQSLLDLLDVRDRLRRVDELLTRELVTLELGDRIQQEIREKIEKQQKDYFLREQIKIIRRELGEEQEPQERDRVNILKLLEERSYPEEVEQRIRAELDRLTSVPSMSPEYPVVRNYLDWLTQLPWEAASEDRFDISLAERILDRDHYGLREAKERILEFLGVRKMRPQHSGPILCLSGPPGVGKTSLGHAIAEATNRRFERMSLGGMRDEAEIKGHRRTYVGALPGRILQMLRRCGTNNPVIMLDEIDKVGSSFRGDPASALLEVLDPEQNRSFLDFYLEIPFDLSKVLFVATANTLHTIPPPLLDRMESIELPGYVTTEKVQIARRHLLARQLREHGLEARRLKIPVATIRAVIEGYTREAGVRGLEKALASLCRKRTLELARGKRPRPEVTSAALPKYLGPARFLDDRIHLRPEIGVALGLAYTLYGGDVLSIECAAHPGSGKVAFTGHLGEVMTESCRLAHTFLKANCSRFSIDCDRIQKNDLHVHFPAGAVPKEGPSAGITIACAMLSRLTGRRLRPRLAMTGEITLTGEVLPIGGVREKVLTARRRGIRTVILPVENERDVKELDPLWTRGLAFVFVSRFEEVEKAAFPPRPGRKKKPRRGAGSKRQARRSR